MLINAQSYRDMDRRFIWHPYSKRSQIESQDFPVIVRGDDVYLFDSDGNRYLDAVSSWWACNLGHGHPRIVEAIRRQAGLLQHSILGNLSHPAAIELAGRLAALFPGDRRRIFFASDGASAVEAALKIALQYWHNRGMPEHRSFISLENAYHGDTLGAVGVGFMQAFHAPFERSVIRARQAESPCCGLCRWNKRPESCALECFDSMGTLIKNHSHETAAVIIEPLCQGAGGMRIYSARYLEKLAALCREHDVLLIADEIAMGFGRTGRMFAFEHAGIDPDIVCIGKGLSGGYLPISAAVVKEAIYDTFSDQPEDHTFYHGHTFAGNPIAAAAALETLKIYEKEKIVTQSAAMGALLQARMKELEGTEGVLNVRGLGLLSAVEFEPAPPGEVSRAQRVRQKLLKKGILIRPLGDVAYLMPPLITPEEALLDLASNFCSAAAKA